MTLGPCGDRCYCLISHLYGSSRISWSLRIAPRWDPVAINDDTQGGCCFGVLIVFVVGSNHCMIPQLLSAVFERCHHRLVDSHRLRHCVPWMIGTRSSLATKSAFFFFQSEECTVALRLSSATHPLRCDATHVDTAKFTAVSILTRQLPL